MNESQRNEIIRLHHGGAAQRRIAKVLGVSRKGVARVIEEHGEAREKGAKSPDFPRAKARRESKLDRFEEMMNDLLARYPGLTAVRLHEELQAKGFDGQYSIVRDRLREIRPRPLCEPVQRFETAPGVQAQVDYSPYEIDFVREGRRRVHAFSYVLGYSRRQYLSFVESEDFTTTIREHVRAFEHLGGLAATCLYDSMKVVVDRWEDDRPVYNARFLAFATHYGFKPWACRRRRPETKGKVERPFDFVEKNLLNGRTFQDCAHLNEVRTWWLANVADVRIVKGLDERPIDRFERERPHLLELPSRPYDTALVVYRGVSPEGYVAYRQNFYSVPWRLIGEDLPVRVTEDEIIVYGPTLDEVARHPLFPASVSRERAVVKTHLAGEDRRKQDALLREQYAGLGETALLFFEELLRAHRCGKDQARRILSLLEIYRRGDLVRALERALKYRAMGFQAIERILAAEAEPRPILEALNDEARDHLSEILKDRPVRPRPASVYQELIEREVPPRGTSPRDGERPGLADPT